MDRYFGVFDSDLRASPPVCLVMECPPWVTVLTIFMFEGQLMQIPALRDIVIYRPVPRAFFVVQKPWDWAQISVQKLRCPGGRVVTGQIDTCINSLSVAIFSRQNNFKFLVPNSQRTSLLFLPFHQAESK